MRDFFLEEEKKRFIFSFNTKKRTKKINKKIIKKKDKKEIKFIRN